jgi:hypothetical protein
MLHQIRDFLSPLRDFVFGDPLAPYMKAIDDAVRGCGYHPSRYEASPNVCCFDVRDSGRAYTCWLYVVTPSVFHLLVFRETAGEELTGKLNLEPGEQPQRPACNWALVSDARMVYCSITAADVRSGAFSKALQAALGQVLDCADGGLPSQTPEAQTSGFKVVASR